MASLMQRMDERFPAPPCRLARWVFLRALGVIYGIAFLSLWVQADGLIGERGILPVGRFLEAVHAQLGAKGIWELPTLCWLNASNGMLHFLCGGGTLLSIALIAGIAPPLTLFLLWFFYLSLVTAGQEFLGFQWDMLLLETGFLAIFFAPRQWLPRYAEESAPSLTILWLFRWLLFRLMFSSGVVKLGDPTWRDLAALDFHYETQPLPTVVGWYAHHLPHWFQAFSVAAMFFVELVAPFLVFGSRRSRPIGCVILVALQALIALTGNYCFFNLLTVALCVLLLDDGHLRRFLPAFARSRFSETPLNTTTPIQWRVVSGVVALCIGFLGALTMLGLFVPGVGRGELTRAALEADWAFHWVNSYGLFANMTTSRREIVIEGSNDAVDWKPYEFKWKPGDVTRAPGWVAPYQPRLDWQMWFAALGDARSNPWFTMTLRRLLEGTPEVLALFDRNPFPDAPPRYVRAVVHDYHFATMAERRKTGAWWTRTEIGGYFPPATLGKGER